MILLRGAATCKSSIQRGSQMGFQRHPRMKLHSFHLDGAQRSVLAQTFAMIEAKMTMAIILQHFSYEL